MRRSIRWQIVGLVAVMLITALTTYLMLANSIVTSDKLDALKDVTQVLSRTAAQQVDATIDALADKLRYFGTARPDPAKLFDDVDGVVLLRVYERDGIEWRESFVYEPPGAAAGEQEVPPLSPLQLDMMMSAGTTVQNVSGGARSLLRVAVAANDHTVVSAKVRPEHLLRTPQVPPLYRVYLLDPKGQVLMHPDAALVSSRADYAGLPVVRAALESEAKSGDREYDNASGSWVASWARTEKVRAIVVAEAPREQAFRATAQLTTRALIFGALMIGITLAFSVYFARRVSAPLQALEETMKRISRGELGAEVEVHAQNELGSLAESFNQMSRELARRSQELDLKNQQLVQSEKMSAIGELSAGLAHEVKNPMVGIVGFAQLGQESTSLDEAKEYFQLIDNDAQRANGILQNLLEFARPPDVEQELLEFNQVVEGAVRLTAHQLQLNGVKVHTDYAPGLPRVRGNGNQLRQVLLNLMMNASQAMEGASDKHLYVSTKGGDAGAQVTVRDVGPGISPEAQARIFEPFFTTKPRGKGTGLGLSVSRSIIEAHRGEIRVESELGKGATFFIRLPSAADNPEVSGPFRARDVAQAS